jgi:hypothetical protein
VELAAIGPSDFKALPGREAPHGAAKPFCAKPFGADARRQDGRRLGEDKPPGGIEIVGMLVMRQQHRVDPPDLGGGKRRTLRLVQRHGPRLIVARRIESRIGQQPKAADLDEQGRAADQSESRGEIAHSAISSYVCAKRSLLR